MSLFSPLFFLPLCVQDIHEFYELTLDNAAKDDGDKTEEVRQLAQKWEEVDPPIPVDARRLAQRTIVPVQVSVCVALGLVVCVWLVGQEFN